MPPQEPDQFRSNTPVTNPEPPPQPEPQTTYAPAPPQPQSESTFAPAPSAPEAQQYNPKQRVSSELTVSQPGEQKICEIKRHPVGLLGLYFTIGAGLVI